MPSEARHKSHVLTLTDAIGDGGAEHVAVDLALSLDPGRFRRSLCVTRPPFGRPGQAAAAEYQRLTDAGVDVLILNRRNRLDVRSLQRLVGYIRSERVDVIHAHKFGSNVWGALLGRSLDVPVVIAHEHTWSFEGQPARKLLDRHVVARYSDAVIAVSEADRRRLIETIRMPVSRVVLIPNGITWPAHADPRPVRAELGIGPAAPVLAMTAILRPQKAIGVMLAAMQRLVPRHPGIRLLIAGPGDQRDLRTEAERLMVAHAVTFLGPRLDVPEILAAADVGVLSSDFEGLPLAVLEYMAAGLPVVATDVGGLPQLVEPDRTGILVPRRDPGALAEAVSRILADPERARAMGQAGRRRQESEFSGEAMSRRVLALYERLLARNDAGDVAAVGSAGAPAATT